MATDYRREARRAARRYGLDPHIFERQIGVESVDYSPDVITGRRRSPAGAIGIAQIMPATAKAWGVDPLDPRAALDAAAKNMAAYVKKYGGYENALRAYNAGPGAIQASRGYSETNNYVKRILGGRDPGGLASPRANRGSSRSASGAVGSTVPGAPTAPQTLGAPQAADFTSLLASLLDRPEPVAPQAAPIQAPTFTAAPALPQGFTPLAPEPAAPEPQEDRVSQALGLLETLRGPDLGQGSDQPVTASDGPIFDSVMRERQDPGRAKLPKSGKNPWGVLEHAGRSGLYLQEKFGIKTIGGYRESDPFPDHPSRKALDLMVYDDREKGDAIANELIRNYKQHKVKYLIWRQRIWKPGEGWRRMDDRGSPTQNHMDHVHVLYR